MNRNQIFKNLIAYFLLRQTVVMLAMLDLSPNVLTLYGSTIRGIDLQPYINRNRQVQAELTNPHAYYQGIWNEVWQYRLHGIGCRLIHISTQERIEWDAPDLEGFRFDWFWNHLEWRILKHKHDPFVTELLGFYDEISEREIQDELISNGIIQLEVSGIAKLMDLKQS